MLTGPNILNFCWLYFNTLQSNMAKGQRGESHSSLYVTTTVKYLSCSCISTVNQPELNSAGDIPYNPENAGRHPQHRQLEPLFR